MQENKAKKKKNNTLGRMLSYTKGHAVLLVLAALITLVACMGTAIQPKVMGEITDLLYNIVKGDTSILSAIITTVSLYIFIVIATEVCELIAKFMVVRIAARAIQKIRNDIDNKMHKLQLNYYDTNTNGKILSTITNDVEFLNNFFTEDMLGVFSSALKCIGYVIIMLTINVWLALIAIVAVPVGLLFSKGNLQLSKKSFAKQQDLFSELNSIIEENYDGQNEIQAFNYQEHAINDFDKTNEELTVVAEKANTSANMVSPITTLLTNIAYVICALLGCLWAIAGSVSVGDIQALLQYTRNLSSYVQDITGRLTTISPAIAAARRIFNFLDEDEEIADTSNPIVPKTNKGEVEFEHVAFGYVPGQLLMNDVSITVKPGQKVAVVGPTGAGKTTLINLLMRFYEINGGKILVDGVDEKDMTKEELRSRFGMVLQDTWLFEGTIMDNLKYGGDNISDEEVYEAAKAASVDGLIATLPQGYNTVLSKGADTISQGERQLLTIARAMATTPEIMILDEATSNVDTHTEQTIQDAMAKLMKGRTSFVIAHRLSTIKDSNMILYMENGDIKEAGSHDELMAMHGRYETLYNSQFK